VTRARVRRGAAGESLAAAWYEARGWTVVDRNWRCRDGELDLVVRQRGTTVFCEVKHRRSTTFGSPAEAVTPAKQRRIRRLAARWLAEHPDARGDVRFDVAAVLDGRVEVLEAAF
jgi:putative endonuclease